MEKSIYEGKKIMISQPMKGKTKEQIEADRKTVSEAITNAGGEVINTIFAPSPEEAQNKPLWYFSKAIEAMSTVDIVVFLPGWENARGCVIEHIIASAYGIAIVDMNQEINGGEE